MGFLKKDKIGIVFSGGGGKGAYEAGVWQALREKKLDRNITGVAGTSIGGLTAILFAMDDFASAINLWEEAKIQDKNMPSFLSNSITKNVAKRVSNKLTPEEMYSAFDNWFRSKFLRSKKLEQLIKSQVDNDILRKSQRVCFVTCHDLVRKEVVYYNVSKMENSDDIYKVVQATASIPFIFHPIKLDNRRLVDGGISDNTPIKPLYDAGFTKIIVVKLKKEDDKYAELFPNAKISVLNPSQELGGFLDGALNFYASSIDEKWSQGYLDMLTFIKENRKMFK